MIISFFKIDCKTVRILACVFRAEIESLNLSGTSVKITCGNGCEFLIKRQKHDKKKKQKEKNLVNIPQCWLQGVLAITHTVNSPLTDTLVSGQLYLRTPFQIPVLPPSQTLYLHIPVSGRSLVSGHRHF